MGMKRAALLLGAVLLLTARAWAGRDEVARHYAPVVYQETNDAIKDLFTAFDFDGNWNGDDNAENMECWSDATKCNTADNPGSACAGQKCPLRATVYYTVIETATHWFVQYMPYHPLDWKVTNGHENDTESILAVVAKAGGPFGTLQAMETRFHTDWYDYAVSGVGNAGGSVDGPIHFGRRCIRKWSATDCAAASRRPITRFPICRSRAITATSRISTKPACSTRPSCRPICQSWFRIPPCAPATT